MYETTSTLALIPPTLEPMPMRDRGGLPEYLMAGSKYNIKIGISSVKTVPYFDFNNPPIEPEVVGRALVDYMKNIPCDTLSAVQLGFDFKVIATRDYESKFVIYFNPLVVNVSDETALAIESDPSFPGLEVKIRRPWSVRIRYREGNGEVQTRTLEGALARLFLHENDRNEGKPFYMAADTYHKNKAVKDWKSLQRRHNQWIKKSTSR